ncbi:unnamed protein product [Pipistrellus nathusii]|uniref:Uncharacterized protein n=1 Tax=Pipistrellus nathusii TaxID=59473 RepID=A0ABN9ZY61_PIPNA
MEQGLAWAPSPGAGPPSAVLQLLLSLPSENNIWLYKQEDTQNSWSRENFTSRMSVWESHCGPPAPLTQARGRPGAGRLAGLPLAFPLPTRPRASPRMRGANGRLRKRKME